jgi:hypothetical protein
LIILYYSLVRSILEFGSVVWNPIQVGLKNKIEIIQRRFLRMLAYKFGLVDKSVKDVAIIYQIPTLESRRLNTDVLFIHKLLNNKIDCPDLLEQIYFKIPVFNTRQSHLFYTNFGKNNFVKHSPLNRMLTSCNNIYNFDFFYDNSNKFKSYTYNY